MILQNKTQFIFLSMRIWIHVAFKTVVTIVQKDARDQVKMGKISGKYIYNRLLRYSL